MKAGHSLSILLFAFMYPGLFAQSATPPTVAEQDSTLPTPRLWGRSGTQEPGALAIVRKSIQATGDTEWVGFQARGSIYYGSDSSAPSYPATLTVLKDGQTRLDVERPDGLISSRFSGPSAGLQVADNPVMRVDARDAIRGLVIFPTALMASETLPTLSLRVSGQMTVGDNVFSTVALGRPLPPHVRSIDLNAAAVVTDLYFDNHTGLLSKSVDMVPQLGGFQQLLKRVITYSNYENNNGVLIPMRYDATLNSQPTWSLTLTSVQQLPAYFDASYFVF